jgi:DNA polymerase V
METVEPVSRFRKNPAKQHIPILENCVAAGFPSPATDYMEKDIDLMDVLIEHPQSTFFMRAKGDSMKDAFIPDNALLVVDKQIKPTSGKIVVAVVNGEFTLKRLVKTPRCWVLHPENAMYKPIQITEDMDFQVWGVVTKVIIDAK